MDSERTVLLLLAPPNVAEATPCKVSFELKHNETSDPSGPLPPPMEFTKSVWTCMVDTLYEYGRIMFDLYPDSAALRAFVAGDGVTCLNGWDVQQQNVNVMLASLVQVRPGAPDVAVACCNAIGALEEAVAGGNRPSLCRIVCIVGTVDGAAAITLEYLIQACEPLIASSVAASKLAPDTRWEISLLEVCEQPADEPMRVQTEFRCAPSSAVRARHVQLDRARPADAVAAMLQRVRTRGPLRMLCTM
jgi:hypothetical protein